jgi:hypothetical protein
MKDQRKPSELETRQKEKGDAEDARRLASEQDRKKAYLAREQAIQQAADSRHSEQAGKRAGEEADRLAREETRKKTYSAREKDMAEAHEARRMKDKGQTP